MYPSFGTLISPPWRVHSEVRSLLCRADASEKPSRERIALVTTQGSGFCIDKTCSRSARPPARPERARPKESHEATNKADIYRLCRNRHHSHGFKCGFRIDE